MASFAADVKKELTMIETSQKGIKAELAALIRMNGAMNIGNEGLVLNIQTENAAIARRIYTLLKAYYHVIGELIVRRKMKLKKNNVYIVRVKYQVNHILADLDVLHDGLFKTAVSPALIESDLSRRAYLRGAFMAGGSINNPETSSYHLEIYSLYQDHNSAIKKMMNHYGLNARSIERRNGYITYIKEAESISDFLALIGATQSILRFENVRVVRNMRNSVNRRVNCENANLNKTIDAASKQIENILLIQSTVGLGQLPEKLQEIALLRLDYPEISLKELGERLPSGNVSKSGVNHRLRKINQFAERLRRENYM